MVNDFTLVEKQKVKKKADHIDETGKEWTLKKGESVSDLKKSERYKNKKR